MSAFKRLLCRSRPRDIFCFFFVVSYVLSITFSTIALERERDTLRTALDGCQQLNQRLLEQSEVE